MRPKGPAASALVVAALAWPTSSWAQDLRAQGLFTGSVGATDNVANAPSLTRQDQTGPTQVGPEPDVLFGLSPGVAFLYDTPRTSTRLAYALNLTLYGSHREANSYTNLVSLATRVETTETTNLFLGVTGEQGQLNALVVGGDRPVTQPAEAVPVGDTTFYRIGLQEGFEKALSDVWTATQSTAYSVYLPVDGQRAWFLDNALGLARAWEFDTGSATVAVGYADYQPRRTITGEELPAGKILLNRATLGWLHAYSNELTSQLDLGVLVAMRADGGEGEPAVGPLGAASLRYARDELESSLTYSHAVAPNLLLGTNLLSDSVTAHVAIPIAATYVTVTTTGTVARARELNVQGNLGPAQDFLSAEVAALWAPLSTRGNLQVGLHYQVTKQGGDADPPPGFVPIQGTLRNTVLATIALAWPDVAAATAPPLLSPPFRPRPEGTEDIERAPGAQGPGSTRGPAAPKGPTGAGGS